MLLLSHVCSVARNQPIGTNGRRAMTELSTGVPCLAIPMSGAASVQNGFELGRGYDFYFNFGQDIKVGDKITWNGDSYTVSAREVYNNPFVDHIHVIAKQEVS
jgi:hypothetical protein